CRALAIFSLLWCQPDKSDLNQAAYGNSFVAVIAGLDPAIHAARPRALRLCEGDLPRFIMDARVKPGHDRVRGVIAASNPGMTESWRRHPTGRSSAITLPSFGSEPGATSFTSPRTLVTACSVAVTASSSAAPGAAHSA